MKGMDEGTVIVLDDITGEVVAVREDGSYTVRWNTGCCSQEMSYTAEVAWDDEDMVAISPRDPAFVHALNAYRWMLIQQRQSQNAEAEYHDAVKDLSAAQLTAHARMAEQVRRDRDEAEERAFQAVMRHGSAG